MLVKGTSKCKTSSLISLSSSSCRSRQQIHSSGLPYRSGIPAQQSYTSQPFPGSNSQLLPASQALDYAAAGSSALRPTLGRSRPRPVTMHGSEFSGFNYQAQGQMYPAHYGVPANMAPMPTHNGVNSRTFATNQAFYEQLGMMDNRPQSMNLEAYQKLTGTWNPNAYTGAADISGMGLASNAGVQYAPNEVGTASTFGNPGIPKDNDYESNYSTNRKSGSSFTMSTTGAHSEIGCCDDYSVSASETPSFVSDYPPQSSRTSLLCSIHSPITSPRINMPGGPGLHHAHSRGKASPSSKPSMRSVPYSADGRSKRWSTGSYTQSSRRQSPFIVGPTLPEGHVPFPPQPSSPFEPPGPYNHFQSLNMGNLQSQQFLYTSTATQQIPGRNTMVLPSNDFDERTLDNQAPRQMPHSLFRMLQSNASPPKSHTHYENLSDRPDLRAALHEEQCDPPPEDMNPSDPSLIPHEQELRFPSDLYTPRWIRGQGKEREGWCGICKPGKWLILKTSAFWYDKSFMHGISAPTGKPFAEPVEMRRSECNPEVWEGCCGGCGEWVQMVSHKRKGTTWFRHAYRVSAVKGILWERRC